MLDRDVDERINAKRNNAINADQINTYVYYLLIRSPMIIKKSSFLRRIFLACKLFLLLATAQAAMASGNAGSNGPSPARICILVEPSPITYTSGYSNRFKSLFQYLALDTNDDVHVLTTEAVAKDPPREWMGIPIQYTWGVRLPHYPPMSISLDYNFKALRTIAHMKPDIIHVSSPGFLVFQSVLCARLFQIPLVISYHTHLPIYVRSYLHPKLSGVAEWFIWRLIRVVHSLADLTVVTSPQILEEFQQHKVPRCQVWQKGVDIDRFHPRFANSAMRHRMTDGHPDDFLIVYIGRFGTEKRLKDLKGILEKLPDNTCLCLVGAGPQDNELRDFFVGTRTVFTGMLTGDELSSAFASADAFCMPSDSETLGFVVLESMASSTPVVGAAAGGLIDIIDDGRNGFLVPPGDIHAFANRLRKLQSDFQLRQRMGLEARKEAELWGWKASMRKLRTEQYEAARYNFLQRIEQRVWRHITRTKKHD